MIKVNSGKYKGRKVEEPDSKITRPTKNITKLGLFNIISSKIEGSIFLDLYSGSGQIGIEALSRGSKKVYFNELNKNSYKIILKNLEYIDSNDYEISNLDSNIFLNKIRNKIKFDIIYIDPPYKYDLINDFIDDLIDSYLKDEGYIIFEREEKFNDYILNKYNFKEYKYGRSKLYVYKKI